METAAHPVCQSPTKRQYRTADERRRIVEETLVPGISVAAIARAHGINANQVFAWRKLYQAGLLGSETSAAVRDGSTTRVRLLPVSVAEDAESKQLTPGNASAQCGAEREAVAGPGSIELTLANARVLITGQIDVGVLRVMLECLRA